MVTILERVPDHVLMVLVCRLVHLYDRWHGLARVSRRWRRISLASVHYEQHVDLTWCTGKNELEATTAALLGHGRQIPRQVSQVQSVALYGPRVTLPLLCEVINGLGCEKLRHVRVESKQIVDAALEQLCRCNRLRTLVLHCVKLTDKALLAISRTCETLTSVNLSGCPLVSDDGVNAIVSSCLQLQQLNLTMCRRITDRSVVAMAHHPSLSLEELILDRCLTISGPAIRLLMTKQSRLRTLSFARCPKVQGSDFYSMAKETFKPSELTALDLSGCAGLDDEGVADLLYSVQRSLRTLNLGALSSLGSATFDAIARCVELTSLNLSLCRTLSNEDLEAIVSNCSHLSVLLLNGCVALDDAGIKAIARYAVNLQHLSLEFCYNLTDDGFAAVVSHCHYLRHLNVKTCSQLTIAAFQTLTHRHAPIETLYIGACADMKTTATYCAIVKQKFPRCRVHWV